MRNKPRVFLDTSILFSAVYSETGGARYILKLGEMDVISLWVGSWGLKEAEAVLDRKSPQSKGYFALLLERTRIQVGETPTAEVLHQAQLIIAYRPDAQAVAEALVSEVDYFVSFDRKHLVGNPNAG